MNKKKQQTVPTMILNEFLPPTQMVLQLNCCLECVCFCEFLLSVVKQGLWFLTPDMLIVITNFTALKIKVTMLCLGFF